MKIKSVLLLNANKKGWLRIVEAFLGILLIMSTLIIVIQQQRTASSSNEEVQIREKDILNLIVRDDSLRSEILSWKAKETNERIKPLVPSGYNYSIELCRYNELCPLNFTVQNTIYSDETIIVANITHYVSNEAVKIKLYFWKGAFPTGQSPRDYSNTFPH